MTEKLFRFFVLLLWFGINHHWNHIHSPSTCLRLKQMPKAMFKDEKELKSNGPKECVCIKFVHITKIINHLSYWHVNHIPSPFSNTHTHAYVYTTHEHHPWCILNTHTKTNLWCQYVFQALPSKLIASNRLLTSWKFMLAQDKLWGF